MSTILKRVFTATILAPGVIALLFFSKRYNFRWAVGIFLAAAIAIAILEYSKLVNKTGASLPALPLCLISSAGFFAYFWFFPENTLLIICSIATLSILVSLGRGGIKKNIQNVLFSVIGLAYIPWLLHYFYLIYQAETGIVHTINLLLIVWGYDTGAYLTGRLIGKHKISPKISPNKTAEGVVGGMVFAYIGASLSPIWIPYRTWIPHIALIAVLVGLATQLGDLFQSILKRKANVKDSGKLLPGHGGLLDRIDGFLFAIPVFYFYYHFILRFV